MISGRPIGKLGHADGKADEGTGNVYCPALRTPTSSLAPRGQASHSLRGQAPDKLEKASCPVG